MGNCCKQTKRIIKNCDFFGTFITFRINDEIEYKSIIGGIASISIFILGFLYTLYVGIPFVTRKNIEFIYSNKIIENQPFINLTQVKFNLAFGIQYQEDAVSAIEDFKEYFNYSIILKEWIGVDDIYEYKFGFKKCTKSDFYNLVNNSFERNQIDYLYCPELNDSANFTLDGLFTDYYYKFIELEIRLNDYGMSNFEKVKSKMQSKPIEMSIYFLDAAIHYQNRTHPILIYINYVKKGLDLNFVKKTDVFISTIEFTNDDNLFYSNEETIIDTCFDTLDDSFHLVASREASNESLVGKFIIQASSKVLVLERKYQKLPSFIADLTGILEEVLLILLFVINIMERQAIDNKLIHKMLKIKGSKYYDIDYYLNVFNREKINNEIMNLIKRGNLHIEKKSAGGIFSKRKSIMTLLDNKKFGNKTDKINHSDFFLSKSYFNNSNRINNFFENEDLSKQINLNTQNLNDNNIKVQTSERDTIKLLNSPKNITIKNYNNNKKETSSFSISSISSKEIDNWEYKKKQSESSRSSIRKEELNINNNIIQTERTLFQNKDNTIDIKLNSITIKKNKDKKINDEIKNAEDNFASIDVVSAVYTSICFWTSKYQKRRHELLIQAEKKIHYYLEIFNYIKGMQAIDLLKYCLLNKEQISLFNYLAIPPLKTNKKAFDGIYKEFESQQNDFQKFRKNEIDDIYKSYNSIMNKDDITFEDLKLLRLIRAEVQLLC